MDLFLIVISSIIINNFVLAYFLGICPFLGVSKKIDSAFSMGLATTFVMTITAMVAWSLNYFVLSYQVNIGGQVYALQDFLKIVSFILVIASLVQLVEMFIKKVSPPLYRTLGIYLPLITTNCAIMGLALLLVDREYNFIQSLVFGFSAGAGFTLAIVIMAGIREELELADIPKPLEGAGITLITAGLLALAFMGFAGFLSN